jgi:hypothetical protein
MGLFLRGDALTPAFGRKGAPARTMEVGPHEPMRGGDDALHRLRGELVRHARQHRSQDALALRRRCQIYPLPICRYRFPIQSNLVWNLIKPVSNFAFNFHKHIINNKINRGINNKGTLVQ